ncbi:MAG: hypothetical protein ACRDBX_05495 [Erysipelotrichaceae bacterium]
MTHELMQGIIMAFGVGMAALILYSMIADSIQKHKRKKTPVTLAPMEQANQIKEKLALLDAEKVILADQLKTNPFHDFEGIQNDLEQNMEQSKDLILALEALVQANVQDPAFQEVALHLEGYKATFQKQDAFFAQLLHKLHDFVLEKANAMNP